MARFSCSFSLYSCLKSQHHHAPFLLIVCIFGAFTLIHRCLWKPLALLVRSCFSDYFALYIYFCSTSSLKTLRFCFFFPSMGLSKEKIIKVSFTETVFIEWWQLATPIIQLGHEETKGTPLKINPLGRY